jgi:hypothetical protein
MNFRTGYLYQCRLRGFRRVWKATNSFLGRVVDTLHHPVQELPMQKPANTLPGIIPSGFVRTVGTNDETIRSPPWKIE